MWFRRFEARTFAVFRKARTERKSPVSLVAAAALLALAAAALLSMLLASALSRRPLPRASRLGITRRGFKLVDSSRTTGFRTFAVLTVFSVAMLASVAFEDYQNRGVEPEPEIPADEVMDGTAPVQVLPSGKWVMLDGSIRDPPPNAAAVVGRR